ncbi:hypothetical protein L596_017860 [Steinernema carpocapsae]|uniref:Uncharacterized protein n=1 Tax=Steinernema carpocapsae TaxID=34508 RepID=A0A4U5N2W6_STECR|nr:hypothetical protein L596_017860 [Steinernema carpocapsae]
MSSLDFSNVALVEDPSRSFAPAPSSPALLTPLAPALSTLPTLESVFERSVDPDLTSLGSRRKSKTMPRSWNVSLTCRCP